MGDTWDEIKGRGKEAAGAVTDRDDLKAEGEADQTKASVKGKVDSAADWAKDKIDDANDSAQRS